MYRHNIKYEIHQPGNDGWASAVVRFRYIIFFPKYIHYYTFYTKNASESSNPPCVYRHNIKYEICQPGNDGWASAVVRFCYIFFQNAYIIIQFIQKMPQKAQINNTKNLLWDAVPLCHFFGGVWIINMYFSVSIMILNGW